VVPEQVGETGPSAEAARGNDLDCTTQDGRKRQGSEIMTIVASIGVLEFLATLTLYAFYERYTRAAYCNATLYQS
jgi:hypothetical protein